jgi:hypothetical protein
MHDEVSEVYDNNSGAQCIDGQLVRYVEGDG